MVNLGDLKGNFLYFSRSKYIVFGLLGYIGIVAKKLVATSQVRGIALQLRRGAPLRSEGGGRFRIPCERIARCCYERIKSQRLFQQTHKRNLFFYVFVQEKPVIFVGCSFLVWPLVPLWWKPARPVRSGSVCPKRPRLARSRRSELGAPSGELDESLVYPDHPWDCYRIYNTHYLMYHSASDNDSSYSMEGLDSKIMFARPFGLRCCFHNASCFRNSSGLESTTEQPARTGTVRNGERSPYTPWDWHICRSVGVVPGGSM